MNRNPGLFLAVFDHDQPAVRLQRPAHPLQRGRWKGEFVVHVHEQRQIGLVLRQARVRRRSQDQVDVLDAPAAEVLGEHVQHGLLDFDGEHSPRRADSFRESPGEVADARSQVDHRRAARYP